MEAKREEMEWDGSNHFQRRDHAETIVTINPEAASSTLWFHATIADMDVMLDQPLEAAVNIVSVMGLLLCSCNKSYSTLYSNALQSAHFNII